MLKEKSAIKVGGRGRNIHFTLDDEVPLRELEQQVRQYLEDSAGFFLGARVSVDVGGRLANTREIERLRRLLEQEYFLEVSQWRSTCESMELGLSQVVGAPAVILPPELSPYRERTLLVKGGCRSGADLQHEGDVVVVGDVNPGAQVTAAGDIIVFGALYGAAAAGALGDEDSIIAALSLKPSQLRIGRRLEVGQQGKKGRRGQDLPRVARVQDGKIVFEPFDGQLWRFRATEGH